MGGNILFLFGLIATVTSGTIDPSLLSRIKAQDNQDIIIALPPLLQEIIESPQLPGFSSKSRTQKLVALLQDKTESAQAELVNLIHSQGFSTQQFWISNKIAVENASVALIESLANTAGDFLIREPAIVSISPAVGQTKKSVNITRQDDVQWGVARIGAPEAWVITRGENTVVGITDTGVNLEHEALSSNFGGAWLDPYYDAELPTDSQGHGTHALGSAVGTSNGIGVAPGARWIACRGLNNEGSGTEANLITCAQFMLTANPKPNVVSNSWGGSGGRDYYSAEVAAWKAAGIIPVFAIGNGGYWGCETVGGPGDLEGLIGVGATTSDDVLAEFSAKGWTVDGRIKPEVSAPGQDVISADAATGGYTIRSGTSMATPHVAGAVALYLSAHPNATYEQVLNALTSTAFQPELFSSERECGTAHGVDYPNNAYGHGRINIVAALQA